MIQWMIISSDDGLLYWVVILRAHWIIFMAGWAELRATFSHIFLLENMCILIQSPIVLLVKPGLGNDLVPNKLLPEPILDDPVHRRLISVN